MEKRNTGRKKTEKMRTGTRRVETRETKKEKNWEKGTEEKWWKEEGLRKDRRKQKMKTMREKQRRSDFTKWTIQFSFYSFFNVSESSRKPCTKKLIKSVFYKRQNIA